MQAPASQPVAERLTLEVNGVSRSVSLARTVPLLWALRHTLGLRGTKYGCGVGKCGICVVLVNGKPVRSCVVAIGSVAGSRVTTIEGLAAAGHPLIDAWIEEQVPQCGYCQPGQILAAAALLTEHLKPTDEDIDAAMSGVLCRCGTYNRIRRAIHRAAAGPSGASRAATSSLSPGDTQGERHVFNPWVQIGDDGSVMLTIDRSEMGQGVTTALAMLVAEELEADWSSLTTQFAPVAAAYRNPWFGVQLTGGSTGVRASWDQLREAGASARERLIAAAAQMWDVPRRECRAREGRVFHDPSGRSLGYGALARAAAQLAPPARVRLKEPDAFRIIGQPLPRIELPDMVLGRAVYGADVVQPGCVYATVARSPVVSGATPHYDPKDALAIPGVQKVITIDAGVAVVADNPWSAFQGRSALQIRWKPQQDDALDSDAIRSRLRAVLRRKGSLARSEGDAQSVVAAAPQVIEAFYETPYLAHAALEPMNCTAHVTRDACEVWVPTQAQDDARDTAASESGLPKQAVRVHTTFLGGGFGRRLHSDFVAEAVQLSRKLRAPVQVLWSRDDDLQHDFYRPANAAWLRAVLRRGRPQAWFQRVAGPDLALDGVDIPYAIQNIQVEWVRCDPGVPTGPWRSVGESQNAFAVECFMDELASAAGADPLEFRLGLLPRGSRHRGVLELAARNAHWGEPLPPGRGRGIAVYHSYGSWVAEVAEASVAPDGEVRVHRVVCAIDCGIAVNPDTVSAQLEGAIAFALSAALFEAITLERGQIRQASFEDYRLLVMREMPAVEVHILPSREPPGGVGEPGVPPLAAAVANAICAASGKRIRKLPLQGQ